MAQKYVFMTDSDSDLPGSIADAKNIPVVRMPYTLDGVEYFDDSGRSGAELQLFRRMREGSAPSTSLLPTAAYLEYFEPILQQSDLLFVAFSSEMSATIQNVYAAQEELKEKYPERKFMVVDTLTISYPMSLLVLGAHQLYEQGAPMDEVAQWLMDNRLRANAWFTVDDLVYLKRGGRVSPTSAFVGSMLDIKPILALSRAGKIEAAGKVQGRKKAMRYLADKTAELIENAENQEVYVLHADAEAAANELAAMIKSKVPQVKSVALRMIGPVIGSHCGPGTLCVAFMGKERAL
ncbi:MAG: DegV family protein [Eubacteriales bacterium]|jgi:DegV family protein with EDD domain|nr:DegV family protein [Eubacteriales bacterium]MDD4105388.1 DegV family protein [Eubacteriales bacterium]MDD4709879.1 DegV family protein [Eubacteriales bacterium]NLO15344.1 DegV family protein [Clostridiales bacterium]